MFSSVHISIDNKLYISGLVHIQYFYAVFLSAYPLILIIPIIKAEQSRQFIIRHIIGKKPFSIRKSQHIAAVTFCQLNIFRRDNPQFDLIIGKYLPVLLKYLLHCPLKIQQINPVRCISHPIEFFYCI